MKKLFFILFLACAYSCQEKPKKSEAEVTETALFNTAFRDYKEIAMLSEYQKVSDTSIFTGGMEDDYRILQLREKSMNLVLFYTVKRDSVDIHNFSYRVLDTLHVKDLKEDEWLSIGYCYNEKFYQGEIISLVKRTDSLQVQNIVKAWRANPESEAVEELEEFNDIICLNENYDDKGQSVSIKHLNLKSRVN